ncbi:MAG TPA: hypothetical protein VGL81_15770 [Polyangiaceae bacterium]|jgi:hypothetical protein
MEPISLPTPAPAGKGAHSPVLPRVALALCGLSYAIEAAGAWVLETQSHPGAPALAMAACGALLGAAALVTGTVAIVQAARRPARPGIAPAIAGTVLATLSLLAALALGLAATLVLSLEVVPIH